MLWRVLWDLWDSARAARASIAAAALSCRRSRGGEFDSGTSSKELSPPADAIAPAPIGSSAAAAAGSGGAAGRRQQHSERQQWFNLDQTE